ncbi:MAG TPA: VTT domain-containing protein [Vicinamibacterales bacterium]|nr:VTT domain-containing protein [Vicinamibacterales bacterium]
MGRFSSAFVMRGARRTFLGVAAEAAGSAKPRRAAGIQAHVPMTELPTVVPFVAALSLAGATLASEDLACVTAGVLVASGTISFTTAVAGCLSGIVIGDLLLMLAGRVLGRTLFTRPWVRRVVSPAAIERATVWMRDRGPRVIALSRFVPGTRLATYVAAGVLGVRPRVFVIYVTLTALVWVPAIVSASALAGATAVESGLSSLAIVAIIFVALTVLAAAARRLATTPRRDPVRMRVWRACRRFYGLTQRATRWEFWPVWILYAPVAAYIGWLMLKYQSATVFTAANPDIPGGGFVGESKFDILRSLAKVDDRLARAALVPANQRLEHRLAMTRAFMDRLQLDFPVVLKPDQGQRGSGVAIVRSEAALRAWFERSRADAIVQEYIGGLEFGIFYYRLPGESRGRIFSITEKRFPAVTGDGEHTLEDLILADARAVCLSPVHRRVHRDRLSTVPTAGTIVPLVEIGSHCRGSLFLDATPLATSTLEAAVDDIAQRTGGFYFGRFDVRTPSIEALTTRAEFRILELNGVTSEATHIYDPRYGLLHATRVLMTQWRLAFEIGYRNRSCGVAPASIGELVMLARQYRRVAGLRPLAHRSPL